MISRSDILAISDSVSYWLLLSGKDSNLKTLNEKSSSNFEPSTVGDWTDV